MFLKHHMILLKKVYAQLVNYGTNFSDKNCLEERYYYN